MINSSVTATLYVCVDDFVKVNLDGNLIGTYQFNPSCQGQQSTISFGKGLHTLMFSAVNTGGPAGLEFALYCQDSLLMHSDGSWAVGSTVYENETNIVSRCPTGVQLHIILASGPASALIEIYILSPFTGASACTSCTAGSYYNYSGKYINCFVHTVLEY